MLRLSFILNVRRSLKPVFHQEHSKWLHSVRCLRCSNSTTNSKGRRRDVATENRRKTLEGVAFTEAQSRSVFAAGTAKRRAERARVLQDEKKSNPKGYKCSTETVQLPDQPLSVEAWRKLKKSKILHRKQFEVLVMEQLIKAEADVNIAKSLLNFALSETGTLSYAILLKYLCLCNQGGHNGEALDVYDIMRGLYPSLDPAASTLFLKVFSRTPRWREAVGILQDMNEFTTPTARNYCDVIAGALLNSDLATAWTLYDELLDKGLSPYQSTWDSLFKAGRRLESSFHQERLLSILHYMRENQIYPQQTLVSTIKAWFESLPGQNWRGLWTQPAQNGVCHGCGKSLESIQLTDEEYQLLKNGVMTDLIQGLDVYTTTTPEELNEFQRFMNSAPAFDVVVDGLNVMSKKTDNKNSRSTKLLRVVSELNRQGLTILVLGRKHMMKQPSQQDKNDMRVVQQMAHCFLTENISKDDHYLLYAAIHSGKHCRFVSMDLMRDHKARLRGSLISGLFFKWQRGHQMVTDHSSKSMFQSILPYDTIVQTSGDSWHIPYDDTDDRSYHEIPQKWLCLSKTPRLQTNKL